MESVRQPFAEQKKRPAGKPAPILLLGREFFYCIDQFLTEVANFESLVKKFRLHNPGAINNDHARMRKASRVVDAERFNRLAFGVSQQWETDFFGR
jgi:hypothetical protein